MSSLSVTKGPCFIDMLNTMRFFTSVQNDTFGAIHNAQFTMFLPLTYSLSFNAALINSLNNGWHLVGLDLYSGWKFTPTNHG